MRIRHKKYLLIITVALFMVSFAFADDPTVSYDSFVHKIGMLWNNITNHGEIGDDSYTSPAPSCEWPGGSGNSYLYAGCIWLSGAYDDGAGNLVYSVLNERDGEYSPIDSIHVTESGLIADQETSTKYWDVYQPLSSSGDLPLGLEITEKTYAWENPLADDFIIMEYVIKNVGIDTDNDHYPDLQRDIYDFCFTVRWDGDVAKRADWPVEDQRVNQDDHALSNADALFTINDANETEYNGTYEGWEWVTLIPYIRRQVEAEPYMLDSLKTFALDSMNTFMWDGDNITYGADDWGLEVDLLPDSYDFDHLDDDFGNPDVDGSLNSAGFLGWRMLQSVPYLAPKSYTTCTINDDPQNDNDRWTKYININDFHNIKEAVNSAYTQWKDGYFYPEDYRALTSYGELDTLKAGDSIVVHIAYGVGGDQMNGGIYSLIEFNKIMLMAQYIVDHDFVVDFDAMMAPITEFELVEAVDLNGDYEGVDIKWDDAAESHDKFYGYRVMRCNEKMPNGSFIWEELARYENGGGEWPPEADLEGDQVYTFRDTSVQFGFDYFYLVQTISQNVPGYGVTYTSEAQFQSMTPTSAPADNLDNVRVVPNPYVGSARWNNSIPSVGTSPWEHQLLFLNLPEDAVIRIYTLDGDYVDEIKASDERVHGPYEEIPEKSGGTAIWDLVTRNNQYAAPGVYLFTVTSATAGSTTGKFVIIK